MLSSPEEKILNGLISAVSDRQQMLANNLTNVNTPGFARQDLDFNSVIKELKNENIPKPLDKVLEKATYLEDGVKPSYESELAAMSKNHLQYILMVRINGHIYQHLEEATQSGRAA